MIQVLRGLVAIAIVVAIVGQALTNADRGTFNPANFFSYFTILSNIASVWLLGRMALQPSWAKSNAVVRGRSPFTWRSPGSSTRYCYRAWTWACPSPGST
jgi:hypothetical protein